jgi:hypothetical protein
MEILKPSKSIWNWYKGNITSELIICLIAVKLAGYGISYSGEELLKDLKLVNSKGVVNKKGRFVLAHELHEKYHRKRESIVIINPLTTNN